MKEARGEKALTERLYRAVTLSGKHTLNTSEQAACCEPHVAIATRFLGGRASMIYHADGSKEPRKEDRDV
ncbi:hypothetical protein OCAR_5525 [Afipia carboxidovorans OM5]|nr:hypothetical protein OCAR_5525 [Afipia carboxidovorans OM5]